jgi:hypothetical protein
LPSCTFIHHFQITNKIQRWEKKHFNPSRKGSKKLFKNENSKKAPKEKKEKIRNKF